MSLYLQKHLRTKLNLQHACSPFALPKKCYESLELYQYVLDLYLKEKGCHHEALLPTLFWLTLLATDLSLRSFTLDALLQPIQWSIACDPMAWVLPPWWSTPSIQYSPYYHQTAITSHLQLFELSLVIHLLSGSMTAPRSHPQLPTKPHCDINYCYPMHYLALNWQTSSYCDSRSPYLVTSLYI